MTARRNAADQYLQRVGGTYYARVRVPRTLEKFTGQTHIRRSLGTSSRAEANLSKHAMVSRIKAELAALRASPPTDDKPGLSFADAKAIRAHIADLEARGEDDMRLTVEQVTVERAEAIERLYGTVKAQKWFRAATQTTDTLDELMGQWMAVSDYTESTKAGHRKALAEVLAFIEDAHAHPSDVSRSTAIDYVDKDLTQRGLAHATIRDRLVSLGGFWAWMASRNAVPSGTNPWAGHKISKKRNAGSRPPKRTYADAELLALLKGNAEVRAWPTYSYLPDLVLLGMYTGAREEELCSLRVENIETGREQCVITVTDAKTKAGLRLVAVVHPAPLAVLKRRVSAAKAKGASGMLFPELKRGGLDGKYSSSAVKAFGRYRRACGVPDGTDFHSFRRNVITVLEQAGVGQVPIARFVGHKVGTMAGDVYSAGGSKALALEVAKKVRYSVAVEKALAKMPV